jgi:hypothetical protein
MVVPSIVEPEEPSLSMFDPNRRLALASLSSMWLAACGGGKSAAAELTEEIPLATVPPSNTTPTNTTPTPPSPAPAAPTRPPEDDLPPQYIPTDAGDGPTRTYFNKHLQLQWKHRNVGDWTDAKGTPQGTVPFAQITFTTIGRHSIDLTALGKRWQAAQECKGAMLMVGANSSSYPYAVVAGRLSATPPVFVALYANGATEMLPCTGLASFSPSTANGMNTTQSCQISPATPSLIALDATRLRSELVSLRLDINVIARSGAVLSVYEVDAPRYVMAGSGSETVEMGLEALGEAALKSHPDVLRAGDFSNVVKRNVSTNRDGIFDTVDVLRYGGVSIGEQVAEADGSVSFRGKFLAGNWDEGDKRGSSNFKTEHMRADFNNPLRPPAMVEDEMFCRLYVFLEDDWRSVRDANKMAIGWDLRMGWWNDSGYWQSVTGNGGSPGDGRRYVVPRKSLSIASPEQYQYNGHSIRMEAGKGPSNPNDPYAAMRPLQSYVYNLDQSTGFGDMMRLGNGVIHRARWVCLEQQVKMNSLVGPVLDDQGNREATADGLLRTWVDGILVSELNNLRWRRHPQMGIQGPWINWYYGGKQPSEMEMHYRMNHFVVARKYIGPRRQGA